MDRGYRYRALLSAAAVLSGAGLLAAASVREARAQAPSPAATLSPAPRLSGDRHGHPLGAGCPAADRFTRQAANGRGQGGQ